MQETGQHVIEMHTLIVYLGLFVLGGVLSEAALPKARKLTEEQINEIKSFIVKTFDQNGDGKIARAEWAKVTEKTKKHMEAMINIIDRCGHQVYSLLDRNGDGNITGPELDQVMTTLLQMMA